MEGNGKFLRGVHFHPPLSTPHMEYIRSSAIALENVRTNKR